MQKSEKAEKQQNDDRITLDYKMELKTGYSTFKLFPDDPNKPEHQNVEQSKNHLMRLLVGPPKKELKFAEMIHNFKGKFKRTRNIKKTTLLNIFWQQI